MKIVVLTGRFGMGHVSAAEAIREELEQMPEVSIRVVDIVDYMFPSAADVIYSGFSKVSSNFSILYNTVNRIDEKRTSVLMKHSFFRRFDRLVEEQKPDVIISTLPVVSKYIGAYIEYTGQRIGYIICITDIAPHSEWIAPKASAYMAGDEMTKELLIGKGIAPEQIYISGIPVRKAFKSPKQHKNNHNKEVLIIGGGLGLIPGADKIMGSLTGFKNVHVTVITGKNKKLREALKHQYKEAEIIGYTNNVSDYMKKADLVISKAGGITVFEAVYSETPILALQPFLEQEIKNAELIKRNTIGLIISKNENDVVNQMKAMLFDKKLPDEIKENMRYMKNSYEACTVSDVVCKIMSGGGSKPDMNNSKISSRLI